MAPSIENQGPIPVDGFPMETTSRFRYMAAPSKNVTFAVNYELAMVDQFLSIGKRTRFRSSVVESPTSSTVHDLSVSTPPVTAAWDSVKNDPHSESNEGTTIATTSTGSATTTTSAATCRSKSPPPYLLSKTVTKEEDEEGEEASAPVLPPGPAIISANSSSQSNDEASKTLISGLMSGVTKDRRCCSSRRVSTRDKHKREAPLARTRVRYDMQQVPPVQRSTSFLETFDPWWMNQSHSLLIGETSGIRGGERIPTETSINEREELLATTPTSKCTTTGTTGTSTANSTTSICKCSTSTISSSSSLLPPSMALFPFVQDSSVIWSPTKRSEWEDSVSEMTAVCTSAAIRRLAHGLPPLSSSLSNNTANNKNTILNHGQSLPSFVPPLSRDYIRDRLDIDDPLKGYQIRHKEGGWLQGFITFTQFTTWTYGFHWDSKHELCGIPVSNCDSTVPVDRDWTKNVDSDGSLAHELEALPRSGEPGAGGIVFSNIAEIALLGGLGCGEYLLRMALDDIRAQKQFKYVALQATSQSIAFYERFGFVRVGAICQYGKPELNAQQQPHVEPAVVGYRHWTHANESKRSLEKHGGPSYMMCLKLPVRDESSSNCTNCGKVASPVSFIDKMLELKVDSKPRVDPLGASATPGPKMMAKRSNSLPMCNMPAYTNGTSTYNSSSRVEYIIDGKVHKNGFGNTSKALRRKSMTAYPQPPLTTAFSDDTMTLFVDPVSCIRTTLNEPLQPCPPVQTEKRKNAKIISESSSSVQHGRKCRKVATVSTTNRASSFTVKPPLDGRPMTYVEKQYHSVWLAVPPSPTALAANLRPAPKVRSSVPGEQLSLKKGKVSSRKTGCPEFNKVNSRSTKSAVRKPKKSVKNVSVTPIGRPFYSFRGDDGKFVRVFADSQSQQTARTEYSLSRPKSVVKRRDFVMPKSRPVSDKKKYASVDKSLVKDCTLNRDIQDVITSMRPGHSLAINKKTFKKQKVKSYPRNQLHYYNRVVRPRDCSRTDRFFFVVEYNEDKELLCLVPMVVNGTLLGQRQGRPRYQCALGDSDSNFLLGKVSDYDTVRSAVVMKTPIIASEAWDLETSVDKNFHTR